MWNETDYQFIDKDQEALKLASGPGFICGNVEFASIDQALVEFADQTPSTGFTESMDPNHKTEFISKLDLLFAHSPLSTYQSQSLAIILDELITNASWHGKMDRVEIRFSINDKRDVLISVHDTQGGIPVKEVLKLLDAHESTQVEVRGKGESRGAGVGLYFCKEFCSSILFQIFKGRLSRISCVIPRRPPKTLNHSVLIQYQLS